MNYYLLFQVYLNKSLNNLSTSIAAQDAIIRNRYVASQYDEELKGDLTYVKDKSYAITPGKTFVLDKGELQLYATVDYSGNILSLRGQEYHLGGQLVDGTIDDKFYYDIYDNQFVNESKDIFIKDYNGTSFTVEDKRTDVCLPFNGTLTLSK